MYTETLGIGGGRTETESLAYAASLSNDPQRAVAEIDVLPAQGGLLADPQPSVRPQEDYEVGHAVARAYVGAAPRR